MQLNAIKERDWGNDVRYLGLLYKSDDFSGEIKSSEEGKVFWINKSEINNYKLSDDFMELFELIDKN